MIVSLSEKDIIVIILALDMVEDEDMVAKKAYYEELIAYLTRTYLVEEKKLRCV